MKKLSVFCLLFFALQSCSSPRLKSDDIVTTDFEARRDSIGAPQYFEIFGTQLDPDVRNALQFLYAYMPLPDITDYPGEYFAENAELALRTRTEMPWGKSVPDREFRHFVLPIRVNNENLDGHRKVFYQELKERVKGMSMEEAILEVNHWCHEKATYEPSDSRTHSPLATVSSAIGRCGEESTFAVAALRSIGIPARQVYTPRWAHTDDNHAWVEAWANGKWHFMGACEPEAVLDLGWFNAPASRGMLMNTRAIGRYDGPEEKLLQMPAYTDVNVTDNYAKVDTLEVKVVGCDGKPVKDASVDFCLYNYAEFYPIARKATDAEGKASIVAGNGDLIIWASDGANYAFEKASVGKDRLLQIAISPESQPAGSLSLDITPPANNPRLPDVPAALAEKNLQRKAYEDSLRGAYVGTFVDQSRGNRATINAFLGSLSSDEKARGQALLDNLSAKDLTDVTAEVLNDVMLAPAQDSPLYAKYVLSPRIDNEFLVPFRGKFAQQISAQQQEIYRSDPSLWAKWVVDSISTDMQWQPASVRMSPWAVWTLRRTDAPSRNIFFVASARAMGIPARIDPVTSKPQYADQQGLWHDMIVNAATGEQIPKGLFALDFQRNGYIEDPNYYTHFTISKIENGRPSLLNFPEDATWKSVFAAPQALDEGDYMLVTGQRQADGSVLATVDFFTIAERQSLTVPFSLRQDSEGVKVIGNFNSEDMYLDLASNAPKSILSTTGRGYYVLGLVANGNEPSNHAFRDIIAMKSDLEKTGVKMLLLFPSAQEAQDCQFATQMPENAVLGADIYGAIRGELAQSLKLSNKSLPIFVIADTFNRVVFVSEGYTIGMGRQLLDTLSKL